MTHSRFPKITLGIMILFACAAIPAFAQRGAGGGFHGGGGGFRGAGSGGGSFHGGGGGGFHAGGGGGFQAGSGSRGGGFSPRSFSSPRMGTGFARSTSGAPGRFAAGPSFRSGGSVSSFSGRSAGARPRQAFSSQPQSVADGRWHSFDGRAAGNRAMGFSSQPRAAGGSGWQRFGGARSLGVNSFRAPSNFRDGSNRFGPFRNNPRFGYPFGSHGFREGCWNCGFGWGFGLGWWPGWGIGWPWLGSWGWGPAWIDPIWGWAGSNYSAYPEDYTNNNPYDDNSSYSTQPENYQENDAGAPPEHETYSPPSYNDAKVEMPVLLYMKDRSVYAASDYWVEDGKLHYNLSTGAEKIVDMDQVDVRRTVTENAVLGTQVDLKPRPTQSVPVT